MRETWLKPLPLAQIKTYPLRDDRNRMPGSALRRWYQVYTTAFLRTNRENKHRTRSCCGQKG